MNDRTSYSFSFSYDLNVKPAGDTSSTDLVAFEVCHEYPLPHGQVLLHSPSRGRQSVVTNDVLYSLHQCHQFKTLSEHNLHLQKTIPELNGQGEDINRVLNSISRMGLMLSAKRKAEELQPATVTSEETRSHCYCILTCDRPEAVLRLLDSLSQYHDFQDNNRYFLVDDSREAEHQQRNQALCDSFSRNQGIKLHYFGPQEQRDVQRRLEQALPEHREGIDFLLGTQAQDKATYGRSRNWALFLASDNKLVLLDDDVLFRRMRAPAASSATVLTSAIRSAHFFSNPADWEALSDPENQDPTAGEFTAALGKTLPEALALIRGEKLPPEAFRQLSARDYTYCRSDSRVLITSCGSVGDPGTSSNTWLYLLDKESRENLYVDEASYRRHIVERNLWSGRKDYAFLNSFVLISQITGIDARECLPPYFPMYRNEDLLFGEMLRYLHPFAFQLDLPWAVPHLPLEKRRWKENLAMKPYQHGLLSFSAEMVGRQREQNPALTPDRRLQSLADIFYCLAESSDQVLLNLLTQTTSRHTTAHIQRMSDILDESPEAPGYWRHDLQAIVHNLQQSLTHPAPEGFVDICGDPPAQREAARRLWRAYAKGLEAWTACREWAQQAL